MLEPMAHSRLTLMTAHPVLPGTRKPHNSGVLGPGPDGQPVESAQLERFAGYVTSGVCGCTRATIPNILKYKRNRFRRNLWLGKRDSDQPQNALERFR